MTRWEDPRASALWLCLLLASPALAIDGGASTDEKVPPRAWRVIAVGDVNMGTAWPTGDADLPPDDAKDLFDPVEPLLKPADVTFGNLETVLADEGESHKCHSRSSHCFAFRAPTTYARSLANAGFNLMSIANNHAGDFGPSGRESTMAALDGAGVHHSGPTGDVASWELEGRRIALIAFSFGSDGYRIQEIDSGRRLVAGLAKEHDLVIVSFHAGAEGSGAQHVPKGVERFLGENRGDSRAFAHAMVDAGASLLLGSGPHVLRGVEIYRRRLIAYSLGNFSAWRTFSLSGSTAISAVLRATLAPDGAVTSIRIEPLVIDPPGRPRPDADRRAIDLIRRLSRADFGSPVLDESGEWQMTPSAP